VSALRILYERADSFGHDRNSIYVGGHSAGGHYASLLAVRRDWQAANAMPLDVIKGCLPISGVYRFGPGSGLAKRPRFLGSEGNGADHAASPVFHIDDPPPFLIAYGEKDFPHLILQAEEMIGALRKTGGSVETILFPGRDHFTSSLAGGERDGPWVPRALAFIRSRKREQGLARGGEWSGTNQKVNNGSFP
jgi:arylformamidase